MGERRLSFDILNVRLFQRCCLVQSAEKLTEKGSYVGWQEKRKHYTNKFKGVRSLANIIYNVHAMIEVKGFPA